MKNLLFCLLMVLLFTSCKDQSKRSAFTGSADTANDVAAVGTIPDQSIYMLPDSFITQDKKPVVLANFAGKPTIIAMIFTHCEYACPRLVADIQDIRDSLDLPEGKVNYVLVSFDTERDTPEHLKTYANNLKLDTDFTLLHGSEESVRTLSVLLNVQFQKDATGNFSHSNIVSVLGKDGTLLNQKEGLEANQEMTRKVVLGQL